MEYNSDAISQEINGIDAEIKQTLSDLKSVRANTSIEVDKIDTQLSWIQKQNIVYGKSLKTQEHQWQMQRLERQVLSLTSELESTQKRLNYASTQVDGAQESLKHATDILQNELITQITPTEDDQNDHFKVSYRSSDLEINLPSSMLKGRRSSMEAI